MDSSEREFQKRLAILQLLATIGVTVGAVMLASGISLQTFSSGLEIDSVEASGDAKEALKVISKGFSELGWTYIGTGIIPIVIVLAVIISAIVDDAIKHRNHKPPRTKILFDEMYDGLDSKLPKRCYEAQSVKKLRWKGLPMTSDFSVLNHAREYGMVLVTRDQESVRGCEENNIRWINPGKNPSVGAVIKELESLKES